MSSLLPWNDEQKNVLRDGDKFHGGACLFEGPPDTGKTKVLVTLALTYLLCGFHVILVAPTGAAADNETQDIAEFIECSSKIKQFEPIRVYRSLAETHKLHEQPAAAKDLMVITEPDVHLLELLMEVKKDLDRRSYNLTDMFLHARITERA